MENSFLFELLTDLFELLTKFKNFEDSINLLLKINNNQFVTQEYKDSITKTVVNIITQDLNIDYIEIFNIIEKLPINVDNLEILRDLLTSILNSKDTFNNCVSRIFSTVFDLPEDLITPLYDMLIQKQQSLFNVKDSSIKNWVEFYQNHNKLNEDVLNLIEMIVNNQKITDEQLKQIDYAITQENTEIFKEYYSQMIENGYEELLSDLQNIEILPKDIKELFLKALNIAEEAGVDIEPVSLAAENLVPTANMDQLDLIGNNDTDS